MRKSRRKRPGAVKIVALAAKEAARKLGYYEDAKACQLEIIARERSRNSGER